VQCPIDMMTVSTTTIAIKEIRSLLFDTMHPIGIYYKVCVMVSVNFECSIHIKLIRYFRLFYVYHHYVNRNRYDDRTIGDIGTAL
jgi:hypothetical protein